MTYRRVGDRVSLESLKSEFIGRRTELSTLDAALQRARGGFGSIFLLSGEAGIGKTLLVREFSAFAREAGAKVLEGRARAAP
jgi:predicted ATPase